MNRNCDIRTFKDTLVKKFNATVDWLRKKAIEANGETCFFSHGYRRLTIEAILAHREFREFAVHPRTRKVVSIDYIERVLRQRGL